MICWINYSKKRENYSNSSAAVNIKQIRKKTVQEDMPKKGNSTKGRKTRHKKGSLPNSPGSQTLLTFESREDDSQSTSQVEVSTKSPCSQSASRTKIEQKGDSTVTYKRSKDSPETSELKPDVKQRKTEMDPSSSSTTPTPPLTVDLSSSEQAISTAAPLNGKLLSSEQQTPTAAPLNVEQSNSEQPIPTAAPLNVEQSNSEQPIPTAAPLNVEQSNSEQPIPTAAPLNVEQSNSEQPIPTAAPLNVELSNSEQPIPTAAPLNVELSSIEQPIPTAAPLNVELSNIEHPIPTGPIHVEQSNSEECVIPPPVKIKELANAMDDADIRKYATPSKYISKTQSRGAKPKGKPVTRCKDTGKGSFVPTGRRQIQQSITDMLPVRRSTRKCKTVMETELFEETAKMLRHKVEADLEVKEMSDKGKGVFSTRPRKKGDFICEYSGELISYEEALSREEKYSRSADTGCYMYYFEHKNTKYCIDATEDNGRMGRLLNHSKTQANVVTKLYEVDRHPYLCLMASRDIRLGEELQYDYGERNREAIEAHPWLST